MSLSAARTVLRTAYDVARLPLQVVPDVLLARVQPVESQPRAAATALLGNADQLAGLVLRDDALLEQGARLRDAARGASGSDWSSVEWGIPPEPTTRPDTPGSTAGAPGSEPSQVELVTADPTADLTPAVDAAVARAEAVAALREVTLEPAAPGDEHHLVGHHVGAVPLDDSAGEDKAAFAARQRAKADAEMAADDAAREERQHQAP